MRKTVRVIGPPLLLVAAVLLPAFGGPGVEGKGPPPSIDDILGTWEGKASGIFADLPDGQIEKIKDAGELEIVKEDPDHVSIDGIGPILYGRYMAGVIVLGGTFQDSGNVMNYTGFLQISGKPGKLKMKGMLCAGDEVTYDFLTCYKMTGKQIALPGRAK